MLKETAVLQGGSYLAVLTESLAQVAATEEEQGAPGEGVM